MRRLLLACALTLLGACNRCVRSEDYACLSTRCAVWMQHRIGEVQTMLCVATDEYKTVCNRCLEWERK